VAAVAHHWVAEDFSLAYYPAAHRLLDGGSPYAVTHAQVISGAAFVYPALSALLLAPFALVSSAVADHAYTLLCITLVPATLRVLGVRDWRAYGATMLWFPIVIGWQGENISVPLMFLTALAWRNRDRPFVAGVVVAAAISLKPFLWPLGIWLLATRHWRAAAAALVAGVAFNVLAWGVVGFSQISTYVSLAGVDTRALWREGYSVLAFAHHLGLSRGAGYVLLAAASAAMVVAILQQGLGRNRQIEPFLLTIGLALVASPLVWIHYFALLLVPVALTRPRFGVLWTIPVVTWLLPSGPAVAGWQLTLAWLIAGGCLVASATARARPVVPRPPGRTRAVAV
jgi:alpha-1,2-mannosyltransferase